MRLEDIKKMKLRQMQHIEVRYIKENGELETRCGYFWELRELPPGMTKVPDEYKHAYPIEFPFITVAYSLDRNWTAKETKPHRPEDIHFIRILRPEVEI